MAHVANASHPMLNRADGVAFDLKDELGRRLGAVTQNWLLPTPIANPRILEMFRERDLQPYFSQVPWAGEFAGKFLTSCVQTLRMTGDEDLKSHIEWFVGELIALQADDGYLGPWPKDFRLKKGGPTCHEPWDTWGHYHAMLGLLLWHELSGDSRALDCAKRIGDLFCNRFLSGDEKMHDTGAHEMNQAPIHSLALLYQVTGESRYLQMAKKIEREFALPPAGNYTRAGAAGTPFWETPKPRWESLHPIMGLPELYYITGNKKYRKAFENLWWSMLEGDRHNNGGFTSGEKATGNPYDTGAIETCCTVAWSAMTVEFLRLTGDSIAADELELSLVNSGYGMMSPGGRWVTYNTPMDGSRAASAHTIVFQARPGQPELNCCSVNGPRLLALVGEWAIMSDAHGLRLNFYGAGTFRATLPSGNTITFAQETQYPREGRIAITLGLDAPEKFPLALRIPHWSRATRIAINGKDISKSIKPGTYFAMEREWRDGDQVTLELDMSLHYWVNEHHANNHENFESTWRVFGPAPRTEAEQQNKDVPPSPKIEPVIEDIRFGTEMLTINGQALAAATVKSDGGVLAFSDLFPPRHPLPSFVAVTEITSKIAQSIQMSFTADWWVEFYVNGKQVFSNVNRGGNGIDLHARGNLFNVPLKKGRNTLVLKIHGGSQRGAWISMGRSEAKSHASKKPYRGHASIYRGPVLLTFDKALNMHAPDPRPLDASKLSLRPAKAERRWLEPWMLWEALDEDGQSVFLCDFASAGASGSTYHSWLPVILAQYAGTKFSRANPLRSFIA